ncbi:hypothetical protein [methane-oxidizing endosymbiont of Gigantopelta aegis]|uniref:hypothetical protein n=1 Tax=methane-oxidizing endosymbiont of Gigantopelta aegis TaxID=2794938 RepID=UPI0018DCD013|nr:hypothetical protein [methane-oxidizing endosymbiont of Gigantopelta aegis]
MSEICTVFENVTQPRSSKRLSFDDLIEMAQNPVTLPKTDARAIAPHTANEKTKTAVLAHDSMTMLWQDIDDGNLSLSDIKQKLTLALWSEFACIIYSTASSKPDNRRWRVLVPLMMPLPCERWLAAQAALTEMMG